MLPFPHTPHPRTHLPSSKQWEPVFELDAAAYKVRAKDIWAPRRRSWVSQRVCLTPPPSPPQKNLSFPSPLLYGSVCAPLCTALTFPPGHVFASRHYYCHARD